MHAEPTKPRPVSAFRSWHNHMRADHPKLWHPIRITIVVITVWWILFCLLLAPTDNPAAIVWTIIEIAVLLLSPFFPKSMSLLFLIMSQSGPWLIPGADVNSLPGILYTFGMLAYETNNLVALLLLAYSIGDQLFRQLVLGTSNSNPVAIIAMVSLVLMLGCGLRWNATMTASRAEAEQAKTRLREMESRNHIAEAIHDAVTGDLSAAAFVAQRRIDALSGGDDGDGSASTDGDDGKNADERRDELDKWTQVNDYILSALTNVHRVIDELDMDVTVLEEDADGKAFSDLLKATMADGDRRLRALGFDITSILHVAGGAPSASPSLAGIANDLLRETYANIARHAQSGSKADLSVILKPNAVEITQINQERAFPTEGMRPGGHGLAYFGKQLESHGGKLETTLHDGEWTLFAYLPIPVPETLPPLAGHPESRPAPTVARNERVLQRVLHRCGTPLLAEVPVTVLSSLMRRDMRLPVTRRILGSPSNRRGTRSFFSSALSERWFYQDGGFTGTPSGQRVGEEVALQQQQVARHRLVVGHVRDAVERQERVLPAGRHQRLAQSQAIGDRHIVVGETVDEHKRATEFRRVRDDAVTFVRGRVESQVALGVMRVVQRPVGRRGAGAGRGECVGRVQHGERG